VTGFGPMGDPNPPVSERDLAALRWRTSSFVTSEALAASGGDCVEVALLADGRTAVRNRNRPDAGTVVFTPAEIDAWVKGCQAGEFDDIH
jgi:Domain of unknown function (DUF397)